MLPLISNKQRKEFSEDSKFHEVVGGERMPIKVIKPYEVGMAMKEERQKRSQSMIIELRMKAFPKKKEFNKRVSFVKDRQYGGLYYGIYTGIDRFKNPTWYRILFDKEQEVFNLNDSEDLKKFPLIAMHPSVMGSPTSHLEDPIFSVYDSKEQSLVQLTKLALIPKVTEFIHNLKGKELVQFARYMEIQINAEMDDVMIKGLLAEIGISNPKSFIDKVNTKNRHYMEIYTTAIEVGTITEDVEKGYLFNGIYIGSSKEEVIDKMRGESTLVNNILQMNEDYDQISINIIEIAKQAEKGNIISDNGNDNDSGIPGDNKNPIIGAANEITFKE